MIATDRATGATSSKPVTLERDEGNRPDTNLEGLANLKPVFKDGQRIKEGRFITAGNASQMSDGAAAAVMKPPIRWKAAVSPVFRSNDSSAIAAST